METAKRIVVVVILGLLTVGSSQSAEEPARRISNTRTANCLVKITCDPGILPPDLPAISYLLHSSAVAGKAIREVLDISPDNIQDSGLIQLEVIPFSDSATMPTTPGAPSPWPGLRPNASEYDMMMQAEPMRSLSSTASPARTARKPGETTAQHEARRQVQAAAGARAVATARSRTASTRRRMANATPANSIDRQTCLFGLNVNLSEDVKPAAKEFVSALAANLRQALLESYSAYEEELQSQLGFAEDRRNAAEAQLTKVTSQLQAIKVTPELKLDPTDAAVREQLETIVDLSNLTQAMHFEEVVMELENAVDPPLQIQPNWKDLLEFADIEPTTPAMMDPLSFIKLGKALELLLAGLSGNAELTYVVDDGVIAIATEDSLPKKMVTHVYEIPALAYSAASASSLARAIQESIEPDSWFDLSELGEGTINVYMGNKLAIRQTFDIHLKIARFLEFAAKDVPATTQSQVPPEILLSEKRDLLREKQNIEMETVRLQARQSAIVTRIAEMRKQTEAKVGPPDPVIAELEQLVEMHAAQLSLLERQYQAGRLEGNELADVKEKLTRARIDLARRRQQVSLPAGGGQLEKYNNDLADITIELAEKAAALRVLNEQLGQADHQLTAATMIDPQASRIRMATRAFEMADERVSELSDRIVNLRPPMVSVVGEK